jgi:uncharacterized membrane protein YeaQ/YmgE (transglycosylase-associated protein family)
MRFLTHTPPKAWQLAIGALAVYASAPLFSIAYYSEMLRKGAYPPYADSIGIPISENVRAAEFLAPVFGAILLLLLYRYPGSVSLKAWSPTRPAWSWLCTVLFGLLIGAVATGLIEAWRWKLPLEFLNIALWIWMLLHLRAVVVARQSGRSPAV